MSIGGATPAWGTGKTKITTLGARCRIVSTPDSKIDFAQKKKKIVASEKNKKDLQHPRFPCSPLPKY